MEIFPSVLAALLALSSVPAQTPTPNDEAKSTARVEGTCVDAKGEPIAGVRVLNRIWPGAESTAESDATGHFAIVLEWEAGHGNTWYEAYVRKAGFALRKERAQLRPGQQLDLGRLTLDPGGVLTGSVLDEAGKPLPSTNLHVLDATKYGTRYADLLEEGPTWKDVADSGKSDEHGRFELVGLPPGSWMVAAKHTSTWWRSSAAAELPAGATVALPPLKLAALPDEMRIEGRVLGPGDAPVVGAEVTTGIRSADSRSIVECSARTSSTGAFVLFLSRRTGEELDLDVEPASDELDEGHVSGIRPGARDVVVHLGGTRLLRLHVVDERGQPVEHFGWGLAVDKTSMSVHTGSKPSFHAGGIATLRVPEYPFELEIRSDAHNLKKAGAFAPGSVPAVLEITLTASAAISGQVTSAGRPIAGASVELVQRNPNFLKGVVEGHWNGMYYGSGPVVRTDAQGRFRIANDFPHLTYYARAWSDGYAEALAGPLKVGASEVQVELGQGGTIAGVVRLPRGIPAGGVELEFYREKPDSLGIFNEGKRVLRTRTKDDGGYVMPHLLAGPWLVRIRPSGTLISDLGWSKSKAEDESAPYVVIVADGATTNFDARLGTDELCVLEGRISVGDRIREGYGELMLEGPLALDLAWGGVDSAGRFRLVARQRGIHRLVLNAGPGHHQYKTITDLVELVPGTTTWERDLPIERWVGEGVRLDPH